VLFDRDSYVMQGRLFGGILRDQMIEHPNGPKCPQARGCGHNISDFMRHVRADKHLKEKSIVLAHADEENTHKTIIRRGFHERFRSLPCDGVYASQSFESISESTTSIRD
jgi:hypothetical protein